MNKIVVLGGSFNPPTIAHLKLMQTAMKAIDADKGFFVPTPYWYVERKLKRTGFRNDAMPNELRLKMLESICKEDERLFVSDYEMFRKERGFTYETLQKVSEENPNSKVYFLAGSDKLLIIPRWHRIREFVNDFVILVAKRNGEEPEKFINDNEFLSMNKQAFEIFETDNEIDEVSSSLFREKIRKGDKRAKEFVTEDVWNIYDEYIKSLKPLNTDNGIVSFIEEYHFLSNFYKIPVQYGGLIYQNTEAAFQAQKCENPEDMKEFCDLSPNLAKRAGRRVKLRKDWETVKFGLMEEIVRAKFVQNKELAEKLIQTGDILLIEGNTWGDYIWGVDLRTNKGENHLGKTLMKVRSELKENGI